MSAQSFAEYTAIDAVNWSTLKEFAKSPLHYQHRLANARKDTAGLAAGRTAHTAVFEPDRFPLDYVVFKGKTRRGKKWDEFKAQHPDQTIIKPGEYAKALALRDAVRRHPLAMAYLERGEAEKPMTWTHPETRIRCKGRLDFVSTSKPAIVDLKTTGSIAYSLFASTAYRMGYHRQMSFYRDGYAAAGGKSLPVVVIAVEADAPHDVAVFEYGEAALFAGAADVASYLTRLAYHRETGTWPGVYSEEQILELPAWATPDENEDINDLGLEVA